MNLKEITPQILEKNGFELKSDGWLWTQWGDEFTNYIHIQFRKNGSVRRVEMCFTNVVFCKFMVSDICTIDLLNQLLKLFKIDKQIKQDL